MCEEILLYWSTRCDELESDLKGTKTKLQKLAYMARCFKHGDATCSLPAQGYGEIECAEIMAEDSIATEMLAIINGFESRYDKIQDETTDNKADIDIGLC